MIGVLLLGVLGALGLLACGSDTEILPVSGDASSAAPGIAVTGVGEVVGAPDTLTLTIGVQLTRDSVAQALEDGATAAQAVIDALSDQGVDAEDIQTANLSVFPQYDWTERGQRLLGFTVANTVAATIRSLDDAGHIIDAAVAAGGDDAVVQGVGFSLEDDQARLEAARSRAWDDAERKARQLADLAGVTLGNATRVTEGFESSSPFDVRVTADVADEAGVTPVRPGQVRSRVVLDIVFELS